MRKLWQREPFLAFAILGGVLSLASWPYVPFGKETIPVDARTVDVLVERSTNAVGRELTDDERRQAIDGYVREEILVREAYRNGWHLENLRVRKRLLLAMRAAIEEDVPEPSDAQLRAYYRANADRYRMPASVSFSHVFFTARPADSEDVIARLAQLDRDDDFEAMGEPFRLGATLARQTRSRLERELGASFADAVESLLPGRFTGPIESNHGVHYVRVLERHPSVLPELDAVLPYARVDWLTERRLEIRERHMARIRARYTIVRSEP